MKCIIPEISWHNRDPVLSVDLQLKKPTENFYRLASCGTDSHVLIWHMIPQEDGSLKLDCVSDLASHHKAVNAVRFSPCGRFLASCDTESFIIIWKQRTDDDAPDLEGDEPQNSEHWVQLKTLRGHLDDIYDLCWSPDSLHLISGSVDNSAIIWDVDKGKRVVMFSDAKNFIQGVTWDPENKFVATLSCDGKCRIYCWRTHRFLYSTRRAKVPGKKEEKLQKLFHDDTLKTFYRRLSFSPDGQLLAVPSGIIESNENKISNVTWVFPRRQLNCPALYYPSGSQPSMIVRWCPLKFSLRPENKSVIALPYRMVIAIATKSSIILYDTQHAVPIGLISNIHYTKLTDLTWSTDGRLLVASSTDGYCSVITFAENELGEVYVDNKGCN